MGECDKDPQISSATCHWWTEIDIRRTLLTQIESCLNSRSIIPLSSDPDDLNLLTPDHFQMSDALTTIPKNDLWEIKVNCLGRYQLIQQMFQHFCQRSSKKYLQQLQQRNKWHKWIGIIRENDLIIIQKENLPPSTMAHGSSDAALLYDRRYSPSAKNHQRYYQVTNNEAVHLLIHDNNGSKQWSRRSELRYFISSEW